MQRVLSHIRNGIEALKVGDTGSCMSAMECAAKLVEEKFTSTNNRYATALDVINEFEKAEPYSGVTFDMWSWLHKRLNDKSTSHS